MSTIRIIYLVCDSADDEKAEGCLTYSGDGSILGGAEFRNDAEARKAGRKYGWHARPGARDICEPCWEAGAR